MLDIRPQREVGAAAAVLESSTSRVMLWETLKRSKCRPEWSSLRALEHVIVKGVFRVAGASGGWARMQRWAVQQRPLITAVYANDPLAFLPRRHCHRSLSRRILSVANDSHPPRFHPPTINNYGYR